MSRYRANRLPAASGHTVGIAEAVNDFLLYHQRKGDSESYLRELRSYLIGGVRPKRLKAEIKLFTPDEVERMRQVVTKENARDWAIFMLLLDTGIRAPELCNLRLEDVR